MLLNAVETAIQKTLEEIKTQGISEDELTAARNLQLKSMYSGFYDRSTMAYVFGQAFAHISDPLRYPKFIKNLESIRAEDIPRIVDQYLTNENSITLSLTLKKDKKRSPGTRIFVIAIVIWTVATVLFALIWVIRKLIRKFFRKAVLK